ncbi:MAG TPA: GTP 3',8-cyclase MoaA [Haliangium sp.]|nr:GTP 3',8-cyclase MoaA [Haliangium sp.]
MNRFALPVVAPLSDGFSRRISYLRVSLTDRCNYRCTYCMPGEGMVFRPRQELLTFEEIERLVRIFAGLGVRRVRLTGGEPTVRADVVELVARIAAIEGIDAVVMTSNGHRMPELAAPLARAGLRGVNISIDSLDPERFRALTRRGDLDRVIAGIDAARAAGLSVKLNVVALKGQNDAEVPALCAFAWDRGVVPRFIEHMPMSDGQLYAVDQQLTAAEIRRSVEAHFGLPLVPDDPGRTAHGPARYWRLSEFSEESSEESSAESSAEHAGAELAASPARRLGIISAMSEHFCDTCNRLRLSAVGDLHACLAYDDATSLRDIIRAGGADEDVRDAIRAAVGIKRAGHEFQSTGAGAPSKHMIAIGG